MSDPRPRLFRFEFKAMGSPCEVQLFGDDRAEAARVAEQAMSDVRRLEARYSRYRDDSLLSEINRVAAAGGAITVDDETAALLDYAVTCFEQSDGMFDVTSGILRQAWRFDRNRLPEPATIEALLQRVGWSKLDWDPPTLSFPLPGLELDLGGIVKEYAADRAAAICRSAGVRHGLVSLGGDIALIGPRADGRPWRVGINDPRQQGRTAWSIAMQQGAIATSGDYERCIVIDGQRYAHILNARTGWPVRHLASVSVMAAHCVIAGSTATIAMLREEHGPAWLMEVGLPHLWIGVDGNRGGSIEPSATDVPDRGGRE